MHRRDEAVSPVIAVILMVAITVVLAAAVWVWVGSFTGDDNQPPGTMSLQKNGEWSYTVTTSTGLEWQDLQLNLNGTELDYGDETLGWCSTDCNTPPEGNINAGSVITINGATTGDTLTLTDTQSNSLILTLRLR